MKLFKIEQDDVGGWDTYSDAVVVAEDEEDARTIHPALRLGGGLTPGRVDPDKDDGTWTTDASKVKVTLLGEAVPELTVPAVICASFHAG